MKNKKFIALGLLGLFAMSLVAAVWIANYEGSHHVDITSSPDIVFIDSFVVSLIDTTNGSISDYQELVIENGNGLIYMTASWNLSQIDVEDSCMDYLEDVSVVMTQNGGILNNGANFELNSGTNVWGINISALENSCPQSVELELSLTAQ